MNENTAAIIGFAIAPIVPALMVSLGTPVTPEGPDLLTTIGLFPIGYLFSAAVTGLLGVPLFLLARRLNLVRWWSAVMAGSAIGIAGSIAFQWPNIGEINSSANVIYALTGALAAFVFWVIWTFGQRA